MTSNGKDSTMNKVVYRYEVPVDDEEHSITLPSAARVLHVASRRFAVVEFWTEVTDPPSVFLTPRRFRVFGTGHPVPEGWQYAGTSLDGLLVWHLYEKDTR
jgi:hypothetical protein